MNDEPMTDARLYEIDLKLIDEYADDEPFEVIAELVAEVKRLRKLVTP